MAIIWNDLEDQFRQSIETHIYQLTQDPAMLYQGSYLVSTFYTKLNIAWREVDAYGEISHCDYGECTCNVNGTIGDRVDRFKIRKFLMGLNNQFR